MIKSKACTILTVLVVSLLMHYESYSQNFKSPASMPGDSLGKTTMIPIFNGKLGKKFHHGWLGEGGDHGHIDRSTGNLYNKVRIAYNLPKGKWLLNLNALLAHTNGGFRIWIETDGGTGISESAFMNPYNTKDTWESTTMSNSFSGVEVKSDQPIYIMLLHSCAADASTSYLGSIFYTITAIEIKRSFDK